MHSTVFRAKRRSLFLHTRYDGRGRRTAKAFDSRSPGAPQGIDTYEHIYLSGEQVIETRRCGSPSPAPWPPAPCYQFVWSLRYIDAPVLRDSTFDADCQCDDERLYYLNDPNYNIVALADTTGDIVERYAYSAYGKPVILARDWLACRTASLYANTTLYTGRELDTESGLYYYRARYYNSALGRFVGRDPIEYEDGLHLYRYARNDPSRFFDPTGQRVKDWEACIAGVMAPATLVGIPGAVCVAPYFGYYWLNPPRHSDKWTHCIITCKASKVCTNVLAVLGAITKEFADCLGLGTAEMEDIQADIEGMKCAGWETFFPIVGPAVGALFRDCCADCCSRIYS